MRKFRIARQANLSLDSLVDIVSNTVGILIILAVFMALFTKMAAPGFSDEHLEPVTLEQPAEKILVPWSHPTSKNSIYFYLHRNRLLNLDLPAFFSALADRKPGEGGYPVTIELPALRTRYYPVTNHVYCLEFTPRGDHGELWSEAQAAGSAWQETLQAYPQDKFYYFFWVTGDSFELFRDIRELLWDGQIEVGWKPVADGVPLEICNGFGGSNAFQPQ